MTRSMTAFSREAFDIDGVDFCWELKTVNHRYFDVSFRLPEMLRYLEMSLRSRLRGKIHRGKLDATLKVSNMQTNADSIQVDEGLVMALLKVVNKLSKDHDLPNDYTVTSLMNWPDLVYAQPVDVQKYEQALLASFKKAVQQLLTTRQTEGQALQECICLRLDSLREEISKAAAIIKNVASTTREKLMTRLKDAQLKVDDSRIEQELALLLTKLDVSEEIDRLSAHCKEVQEVLARDEAIGKRLDFLMQELNREANTLSSKSDSIELTKCAMQMKVLIEQMREQVQNIE